MDCELCGPSYAQGANVYFDDELKLELTPFAHCFDGTNYDRDEVYKRIIMEIGNLFDLDLQLEENENV